MDSFPLPVDDDDHAKLVGGQIDKITVSLRILGDDLDPDEISRLLAVSPTFSARRGDARETKRAILRQPVGVWSFDIGKSSEWVLEDLIRSLLDRIQVPVETWQLLRTRYQIEMFCGLFLNDWNRGTNLSAGILGRLAERGIALSLDIYCNGTDTEL